jgi:hypothetical protein
MSHGVFSRKVMCFNKNAAYVTADLRSFNGLLLLLLIMRYPRWELTFKRAIGATVMLCGTGMR